TTKIYTLSLHDALPIYVRNITDVGHLVDDADAGEDKIEKRARLEKIEPMEIVQKYTNNFHDVTKLFNLISPNIEPTATGHIIEQIEMIQEIINNGYAYEVNGSRSEEHTSELQSRENLVCRLLLEKTKNT